MNMILFFKDSIELSLFYRIIDDSRKKSPRQRRYMYTRGDTSIKTGRKAFDFEI